MRCVMTGWPALIVILATVCLPLAACKKDGESGGGQGEEVAWPEPPADGSPVAFEFLELTGEGDDRAARLRIFNFTDKNVQAVQLSLHYLDEAGEELRSFPWGATAPSLVAANSQSTMEAGAFLPEGTASVSVTVRQVTFADGTTWQAPEE
jgi:hypothetical protein